MPKIGERKGQEDTYQPLPSPLICMACGQASGLLWFIRIDALTIEVQDPTPEGNEAMAKILGTRYGELVACDPCHQQLGWDTAREREDA